MTSLYNTNHNFEYYNAYKTAQTSMLQSFDLKWCPIEDLPSDRKVVCILREPLDRLISSYFFLRKRNNCHHPMVDPLQSSQLRQLTPQRNADIFAALPVQGIKEMLYEIATHGHFDDHSLPQHIFLSSAIKSDFGKYTHSAPRSLQNITHWLNFHNLNGEIQSLFGAQIKYVNRTSKDTDAITRELRQDSHFMEAFARLYAEDIQLFREHIKQDQQ